jgi:hypothetical protein
MKKRDSRSKSLELLPEEAKRRSANILELSPEEAKRRSANMRLYFNNAISSGKVELMPLTPDMVEIEESGGFFMGKNPHYILGGGAGPILFLAHKDYPEGNDQLQALLHLPA